MQVLKECLGCSSELNLNEFYTHPQMADGHLNFCKSCVKARVRKHRFENDSVREYDRNRNKNPDRIMKSFVRTQADRIRWPEKYKARTAVNNAVRDGRLAKADSCENCGSDFSITGHHEDYNKPLEVKWLCQRCHMRMEMSKPF